MQLINVAFGGTLIPDIPSRFLHPLRIGIWQRCVAWCQSWERFFAVILHSSTREVTNSAHHQAIDSWGRDCKYRAVRRRNHRSMWSSNIICVQWHPADAHRIALNQKYRRNILEDSEKEYLIDKPMMGRKFLSLVFLKAGFHYSTYAWYRHASIIAFKIIHFAFWAFWSVGHRFNQMISSWITQFAWS